MRFQGGAWRVNVISKTLNKNTWPYGKQTFKAFFERPIDPVSSILRKSPRQTKSRQTLAGCFEGGIWRVFGKLLGSKGNGKTIGQNSKQLMENPYKRSIQNILKQLCV